jgi:hypothetical protein
VAGRLSGKPSRAGSFSDLWDLSNQPPEEYQESGLFAGAQRSSPHEHARAGRRATFASFAVPLPLERLATRSVSHHGATNTEPSPRLPRRAATVTHPGAQSRPKLGVPASNTGAPEDPAVAVRVVPPGSLRGAGLLLPDDVVTLARELQWPAPSPDSLGRGQRWQADASSRGSPRSPRSPRTAAAEGGARSTDPEEQQNARDHTPEGDSTGESEGCIRSPRRSLDDVLQDLDCNQKVELQNGGAPQEV